MKSIFIFLVMAIMALRLNAQKQFMVLHSAKGKSHTYSIGDKLTYSTQSDTIHAKSGKIIKITKDSLYLSQETVSFGDIHTIYKNERWKKRLVYFAVLNTALLIPQLTTSNDVVANLLFIPWFGMNLYFATSGLHHVFSSKELFHIPNDSEIMIGY